MEDQKKEVIIIGTGPAGMGAAHVLSLRGVANSSPKLLEVHAFTPDTQANAL